jgi:hypothetical protein
MDGRRIVRVPVGSRIFISPYRPDRLLWGAIQIPIQWTQGALSPGIKRQGLEAVHSPPTSAEDKKTWVYTYTLPHVSWFSA